MNGNFSLFVENRTMGGYALAVRDPWNFKIQRVHLTDEEHDIYLDYFGTKLLTADEFYEWYVKLKTSHTD